MGLNLKADFSLDGQFGISGSQPGATGGSGVNHFYDDGYVRVDQTGNAQGYTSYWGYNNASQYGPAAQTLLMHSAKSFGLSSGTGEGGGVQVGFDMAYGGDFAHWGKTLVGWELGFGLLPISIKDTRPLGAVFTRTAHSFDASGIVLPTAPYNGGPSGLGPTLRDVATALPDDTIAGTVTGSRSLDLTLHNVRLGPTLWWELHPRWAVSVSGGAALGIVSGDYKFDETVVLADGGSTRNTGKIGATDVVYGGYVSAVAVYHAVANGDIFVGAQFMPLGDVLVRGGGRQARLHFGEGVYLSAGINWSF